MCVCVCVIDDAYIIYETIYAVKGFIWNSSEAFRMNDIVKFQL